MDWSSESLAEATLSCGWVATAVRSIKKGSVRSWFVRASQPPSREFYQLNDGLAVVRPASPRPAPKPLKQQRWLPGTGPKTEVQWPVAWTDPSREKPRPVTAASASQSAPRNQVNETVVSNLPHGQSNDSIADLVIRAVSVAMAQHGAALDAVRADLAELKGGVGGEAKRARTQKRGKVGIKS